jgi:hypothetical protein
MQDPQTLRFNTGQVRQAGSLETSGRKIVRNSRVEIERESTSMYDDLFKKSTRPRTTARPTNNQSFIDEKAEIELEDLDEPKRQPKKTNSRRMKSDDDEEERASVVPLKASPKPRTPIKYDSEEDDDDDDLIAESEKKIESKVVKKQKPVSF